MPCLMRSPPRGYARRNSSNRITMQLWRNGPWLWNEHAMRPSARSVVISRWSQKIGSSRVDWRQNGRSVCVNSNKSQAELVRRERGRPRELSPEEKQRIQSFGVDLKRVWSAPTTTERDKKEILRTLLEEVIITVERAAFLAHLTLRWKGGVVTEIDVNLPRSNPAHNRTDEHTVVLVRRLAEHYPDTKLRANDRRHQVTRRIAPDSATTHKAR